MSRFFSFFLLILRIEVDKKILSNYRFCRLDYCNKVVQAHDWQTGKASPEKRKKEKTYINELQMELSTSYTPRKRSS